MTAILPRRPDRPPAYDPNEPRYWDARDLETELRRTFQICADCRMCVTYCGSFPILFEAVDRDVDSGRAHGAEKVGAETFARVADHCWQCKLCFIKCPYTADEGAPELLDFPRLMAREKAQRARRDGVPLVDKILGEPELVGALGAGLAAPLANFVNEKRLLRKLTEKVTGISAEFPLPPLARHKFSSWFAEHEALETAGDAGEVVLFPTCYGEANFPGVPRAAVQVLEHNGYSVVVPEALTCCSMPNLDGGDVDRARRKMQANVDALLPFVRRGLRVAVPGPTCGYTMKKEWPVYLGTPEAADVARATVDLMEFLDELRKAKTLNRDFETGFGKVGYHAACHLRAQKIAVPGARLLSLLPDTEVRIIERCSAVDGTWGMKAVYYEEGAHYGGRLARAIASGEEDGETLLVGDCNLAALRVLKESGKHMLHPVEALAEAYGLSEGEGHETRNARRAARPRQI
jgi:glycerol-3-phosphate dehydrogenase subunit C